MTSPSKPATTPGQGGDQTRATGNRPRPRPLPVDVEEVTRRVYALLQEDLRLHLARREGRA